MAQRLPMEERLKQIINENETPSTSAVGESLTVLLVQGLHSGDKKILDKVLEKSDDVSVRATVRQLPVQSIVPLLKELKERIAAKSDVRAYIKWLRYILVCHDGYLSSDSEILEELRPHYEVFQKRADFLPRLLELQGRVNFIMAKIDETNNTEFSKQSALAVFQDASSDSESEFEPEDGKSDTEGNWDNLNWDEESIEANEKTHMVNGDASSDDMEDEDDGGEASDDQVDYGDDDDKTMEFMD